MADASFAPRTSPIWNRFLLAIHPKQHQINHVTHEKESIFIKLFDSWMSDWIHAYPRMISSKFEFCCVFTCVFTSPLKITPQQPRNIVKLTRLIYPKIELDEYLLISILRYHMLRFLPVLRRGQRADFDARNFGKTTTVRLSDLFPLVHIRSAADLNQPHCCSLHHWNRC